MTQRKVRARHESATHYWHVHIASFMLGSVEHFQLLGSVLGHPKTMTGHQIVSDVREQFPCLTLLLQQKPGACLIRICPNEPYSAYRKWCGRQDDMSTAIEPIERVKARAAQEGRKYYFIVKAGAWVTVIYMKNEISAV